MSGSYVVVKLNKMPELSGKLRKRAAVEVGDAAETCAALARSLVAVRSGALSASIHIEKESDLSRKVVADAKAVSDGSMYGLFVEFGTKNMAAQPFLTPAAEMVKPKFIGEMQSIVAEIAQ